MAATDYWKALEELRQTFRGLGSTHQARLDVLVSSVASASKINQRECMSSLVDVADSTDHLRCLLLALLPPEISEA